MQEHAIESTAAAEALPRVEHLVLYDGVCGLCNRFVQQLLRIDRAADLNFAALQGATAEALRRAGIVPTGEDTIVYVTGLDGDHPRAHLRSDAALRILRVVGRPWSFLSALRIVPRPLRDLVYRVVARSRYRLFGHFDTCKLPSPETRERFLD